MNGKQLLIAVIALGVLGALALFTSGRNKDNQSSGQSGIGSDVVTKLDPSKVSSVVITDKEGLVNLEQKDENWIVAERDGFPAKFEDIKKLVTSSVTLKSLRKIRASKSQHERFELVDPSDEKENSGLKIEPTLRNPRNPKTLGSPWQRQRSTSRTPVSKKKPP